MVELFSQLHRAIAQAGGVGARLLEVVAVYASFVNGVEVGVEAEVVVLGDRVVFVVVTTRASQREPHPHGTHRLDPVDHVFGPPLLVNRSVFGLDTVVPIERVTVISEDGGISYSSSRIRR